MIWIYPAVNIKSFNSWGISVRWYVFPVQNYIVMQKKILQIWNEVFAAQDFDYQEILNIWDDVKLYWYEFHSTTTLTYGYILGHVDWYIQFIDILFAFSCIRDDDTIC